MNDEFQRRLESAIARGRHRSEAQSLAERRQQLSEEELRRLHTGHRLALSEHTEGAIAQLAQHFPGFRLETLYGEAGWGVAGWRDDLQVQDRRRSNQYSRLEITVRPLNAYHVLELRAKGTVANKEVFNRNYFEPLQEADRDDFERLIDTWVVEYAELFAAAEAKRKESGA